LNIQAIQRNNQNTPIGASNLRIIRYIPTIGFIRTCAGPYGTPADFPFGAAAIVDVAELNTPNRTRRFNR